MVEGKSIDEINQLMRIPQKTLYNWKERYEWNETIRGTSNIALAMNMQKQFLESVQQAIKDKKLTDPSVADALYKTSKLMEKLLPQKIMLANIFNLMEDISIYIRTYVRNDRFKDDWTKYLPEIADHLRRKYND